MSQLNLGTLMPCGPRHFRDGELPFIRIERRVNDKLPRSSVSAGGAQAER
jgi:hypothetical protein